MKGLFMRTSLPLIIGAAAIGLAVGFTFAVGQKPALAQSFASGQPNLAAASAGPGATDMWAIDIRTNQVIYCRGTGAAPVCRASLVPGAAQPRDNLPK
jgi:hypothetical protein